MTTGAEWRDISECPDDAERPGGQRIWRLLLPPEIEPGRPYSLSGPNAVPEPRETTGRRHLFNNTGWIETGTNRELRPTQFAPLDE